MPFRVTGTTNERDIVQINDLCLRQLYIRALRERDRPLDKAQILATDHVSYCIQRIGGDY